MKFAAGIKSIFLCRRIIECLQAKPKKEFSAKVAAYFEARRKLEARLSPDDYRYFSFQLWQEGIARYSEYRIAELAARKYKPSKEYSILKRLPAFQLGC